MGKLDFNRLLLEFLKKVEIANNYNSKNSNHPTHSVINSTYRNFKNKYHYRWYAAGVMIIFLFGLFEFYYFFDNSVNKNVLIVFFSFVLLLYLLFIVFIYKLPDLTDVWAIGDRVHSVTKMIEPVRRVDFDMVREMIMNIDEMKDLEKVVYLKRYHELTFDKKIKRKEGEPFQFEKVLCIKLILKELKLKQKDEETRYLLASLLNVGAEEIINYETTLNYIDRILFDDLLEVNNLKKTDIEHIKKLSEELDKANNRLMDSVNRIKNLKVRIDKINLK